MSQQDKSQAQVAELKAKLAEQQLHIEVLVSNMFAQKQRADNLQAVLQHAEQERINQEQANEFVSGDIIERQRLLQAAAKKPIATFTQFDYFNMNTGAIKHNRDYDVFMGRTREFNLSGCLRLLIPDDYSAEDVRRALREFADLVEDGQVESMRLPENDVRFQSEYHDDFDAWLQSQELPGKRQRLTPAEAEAIESDMRTPSGRIDYTPPATGSAQKVSAKVDVIFDEEEAALGYPCFRVNVENGGAANFSIKVDENGQPYLQETWRDDEPYTGEVPF